VATFAYTRRESDPEEEHRLVEALKEGSEEAFEAMVYQYGPVMEALVAKLVHDRTEIADVVQEVFFKVFRNIHRFRYETTIKNWIYRAAVNEAHKYRRWFYRRHRRECSLNELGMLLNPALVDPRPSPFEEASKRQVARYVMEALEQVRPPFREAVILRDLRELTYEDMADVLRVSVGTVKARLLRGREALRTCLANPRLRKRQASSSGLSQVTRVKPPLLRPPLLQIHPPPTG